MAFNIAADYRKYGRYYRDIKRFYKAGGPVKMYVDIGFAVMVTGFFVVFAIRPTLITIGGLISDIRAQTDVDLRLEKKVGDLRAAYGIYSTILPRLSVLDEAGPDLPNIGAFLRQVEGLIISNQVILKSISFGEAEIVARQGAQKSSGPAKNYKNIEFSVSAEGGFLELKAFLGDLENLKRTVLVESYTLAGNSEEAGGGLKLTIIGSVLYYPQKTTSL